mgnify:CR=1 FL=1
MRASNSCALLFEENRSYTVSVLMVSGSHASTYRQSFPDFVVGAMLINNATAFAGPFCKEKQPT